jgi:hypothetical protein
MPTPTALQLDGAAGVRLAADSFANPRSPVVLMLEQHPEGFSSLDEAGGAVAAYLPNRPRPRDTPCLLVRGAESDVLSVDIAREFIEIAPSATLAEVPHAGHMAGDNNDAFTNPSRRGSTHSQGGAEVGLALRPREPLEHEHERRVACPRHLLQRDLASAVAAHVRVDGVPCGMALGELRGGVAQR